MTKDEIHRLQIENRQLKASIEIYAKQCNELGKWARIMERIEGQLPELQDSVNKFESRVSFMEDSLARMGQFLVKRATEASKFTA
jgi:CHAD domain-containing protein